MQNMREAAANAGAYARAGFEKAKATVQVQADKMRANDPNEKEMARERKEERMNEAEYKKQRARDQNAQANHTGGHGTPPATLVAILITIPAMQGTTEAAMLMELEQMRLPTHPDEILLQIIQLRVMEAGPQQGITPQGPGVLILITLRAMEAALDVTLVLLPMPPVAMVLAPMATICNKNLDKSMIK